MGNNSRNATQTIKVGQTTQNRFTRSTEWDILYPQKWMYMEKLAA